MTSSYKPVTNKIPDGYKKVPVLKHSSSTNLVPS